MHNPLYETQTFAYFCNTSEAILQFRKSVGMYCINMQKYAFGEEGVAFCKVVFWRRSKNASFENAILSVRNAWFFIFLQYLLYDVADYDVSSVTSRALPTSEMTILAERCCTNRDSAVSSSRRLPTAFGGLWGFLRAAFWLPGLLLGRPRKRRSRRNRPRSAACLWVGDLWVSLGPLVVASCCPRWSWGRFGTLWGCF